MKHDPFRCLIMKGKNSIPSTSKIQHGDYHHHHH